MSGSTNPGAEGSLNLKFHLAGESDDEAGEQASSRRRRWWVVGGSLAAIAILATVLALRSGSSTPSPGSGADGEVAQTAGAASSGSDSGQSAEDKAKAAVPVAVHEVEQGAISSYVAATANLVAEDEVKVLGEAEGRVAQVMVEEGDRVRRGQTLAVLAREETQIAFEKARVREQSARLAYERAGRMKAENVISQEAFDKLTTENDVSRQELAEAEWRLSRTTVRAPFDGHVTWRNVRPGQHVRPGDELFTISDFEPLVARIFLPEKDILGLRPGQAVRLTLKADESVQFAGRIRQISPVVDIATGTVKITVESSAPPPAVRPGGFVAVDIVRETRADAVLVPRLAVLRELQSAHVFLFEDGVARKRAVELGFEEGDLVEVRLGVRAGERVIVAGQGGLRDGSAVRLLEEAAPQTPAAVESVAASG